MDLQHANRNKSKTWDLSADHATKPVDDVAKQRQESVFGGRGGVGVGYVMVVVMVVVLVSNSSSSSTR